MSIRACTLLCFLVVALPACDATHSLGTVEDDLTKCCLDPSGTQTVATCVDPTNCKCFPELCTGGAQCQVASDCAQLAIPCQLCADGTSACPVIDCTAGQCHATLTQCPAPACNLDTDCAVSGAAGSTSTAGTALCQKCADGTEQCYVAKCVNNQCTVQAPTCPPPPTTGCSASSGTNPCPAAPDSCTSCSDGSSVCAVDKCDANGQCVVSYPTCPPPTQTCDTATNPCAQPTIACQQCTDGTTACPKAWCDNGHCAVSAPSCPPATSMPSCTADTQCASPTGLACHACATAAPACPHGMCVSGHCTTVFPVCQ